MTFKLWIISKSFLPITGGLEVGLFNLVTRLRDKYDVVPTVFTACQGPTEIEGIEIVRIPTVSRNMLGMPLSNLCLFLQIVRRIYQSNRPNVLHMFGTIYFSVGFLSVRYLWRIPSIVSLFGGDTYSPVDTSFRKFAVIAASVMNSAELVTSVSGDLAKRAIEQGCKKRINVIPFGMDVEKFSPIKVENPLVAKMAERGEPIILSVHRLVKVKATKYLLDAIPLVLKEFPKARFLIIGSGAELPSLMERSRKNKIQKNVIFTGQVSHDSMINLYSTCDVFVLHSSYESLGISVLEAMASAKPVVVTSVGGLKEVVIDGFSGILVPPHNSHALAGAILTLLKDEKKRRIFGQNARNFVLENFSLDKICDQYIEVYKAIT